MPHQPRPAVKAVYAPVDVAADLVSLGFPRTPLSAQLPDPDGWVRAVLHTLDGRHTVDEVAARFAGSVPATDIRALVDELAAGGFLEEAGAAGPAGLDAEETARYRRNAEFFSYFSDRHPAGFGSLARATAVPTTLPTTLPTAGPRTLPGTAVATRWDPQRSLRQARVVVVGLGGFGSHVALHLAALGVGDLTVVDPDVVETGDLARNALARAGDLGRAKVDAAADQLRALDPRIAVTTSATRVGSAQDAEGWLLGADLVVCAADRPRVEIDSWFNTAALRTGTPWLRGATLGLSATLDLFVPGRTACARCRLHPRDAATAANARIAAQLAVGGARGTSPVISPVAGLLGSMAALEATKFLTGIAPSVLLDHQLAVDLLTSEIHHLRDETAAGCASCAAA